MVRTGLRCLVCKDEEHTPAHFRQYNFNQRIGISKIYQLSSMTVGIKAIALFRLLSSVLCV
jgi:hypothetical protein